MEEDEEEEEEEEENENENDLKVSALTLCFVLLSFFFCVQYAEVVGSALAYELIGGSSTCASLINDGVAALASLLGDDAPYGTDPNIPASLRPCSTMASILDLATYEVHFEQKEKKNILSIWFVSCVMP